MPARRPGRCGGPVRNPGGMDVDDLGSDCESVNVESDEELSEWSDGEDSKCSDDGIDPVVAEALDHLKGAISGYAKKRGEGRSCRDERHPVKRTRHDDVRGKGKSVAGKSSSTVGSRCNNKDFGKIVGALDDRKRDIIRERGFGMLLEYDGCLVPRGFVQWIADHVDVNCCDIVIRGNVIPCSPQAVHHFLGISIGGEDILEQHNDSVKSKFLSEIKEASLPTVKTFVRELEKRNSSLSDDNFFRYFMVVALASFLCPNSSTLPSPKYLGPLIDLSNVGQWDWSGLVFKWMFSSIALYRKEARQTIGGCIYFLAGYYLDFLDFGSIRQLPATLPRMKCWKGSMIKRYAGYDRLSANRFGKRPVKSISETCYSDECVLRVACEDFKVTMDTHCSFLREDDQENMRTLFENHHTRLGFTDPATLVGKMLKYLFEAYVGGRRRAPANAGAQSSAARMDSAANVDGDHGVRSAPKSDDGRVPSPEPDGDDGRVASPQPDSAAHSVDAGFVRESGFDLGGLAGPSTRVVEEVAFPDAAMGDAAKSPSKRVVEEVVAPAAGVSDTAKCPSNIVVEEDVASVVEDVAPAPVGGVADARDFPLLHLSDSDTDIIESDYKMYDGPVNSCRLSASTEILPCTNSSAHESVGRNDKKEEPAKSPSVQVVGGKESVGAKRGLKRKETKSSPSIEVVDSKEVSAVGGSRQRKRKRTTSESPSPDSVSSRTRRQMSKNAGKSPLSRMGVGNDGLGCSSQNPVDVDEEAVVADSAGACEKGTNKEGETTSVAPPVMDKVNKDPVQVSSSSKAIVSENEGVQGLGKEPQLVGNESAPLDHNTSDTTCPVQRATSMLRRSVSKDKQQEANPKANLSGTSGQTVQVETAFLFRFSLGPDGWVLVDWTSYNPFGPNPNVMNEENVVPPANVNVETAYIHSESLPFTDYSENFEETIEPVPLAAMNSEGVALDITPVQPRVPLQFDKSVVGGSCSSWRSIGNDGVRLNSECSSEAAWQSSSSKIAVHRPRRMNNPSIYKQSPYVTFHSKIRVSKDEADLYEALLLMGQSNEYTNIIVVNYGLVRVFFGALASSLRPGGNVSYFVVNAFCRLLFLKKHPSDSRKHFFFSKVGDFLIGNHGHNDEKYQELFDNAVKCFTGAHRAKPLSHSDYMFFPVFFREQWYVIVLYFSRHWCLILNCCDTMSAFDSGIKKAVEDEFLENIEPVWKKVVNLDYGWHGFKVFPAKVPQLYENSICDSGVCAMKYLELFEVNVDMMSKFNENDIGNLRIKLVNDMVLSERNCASVGVSKIKEVAANLPEDD